jgi:hypothetical protein
VQDGFHPRQSKRSDVAARARSAAIAKGRHS